MSAAVAELESRLQAMLNTKAGVSRSRILEITNLCESNVQSESLLVQKLYLHFKKAPATHKLGVLYVVDSVTRKWIEHAKAQGQPITLSAPDGTFAAGVHRVTELMPTMMNDIIPSAPQDQKDKIRKLVDIWDKAQTFPPSMVNQFKQKLDAPRPTNESTTPPGSPPPNLLASLGAASKPAIPSILDTLANIVRQNATAAQSNPSVAAPAPAPASTTTPAPAPTYNAPSSGVMTQPAAPLMPVHAQPNLPYLPISQPAAPPVNAPALPFAFPPAAAPAVPAQPLVPGAVALPGLGSSNLAVPAPFPQGNNNTTVQLVATLAAQGLPLDQIANIIKLVGQGAAAPASAAPPAQPGYSVPPASASLSGPGPAPWDAPRHDDRERSGYRDGTRSPNRARGRSRSRSPPRWEERGSPRSRGNERGFGYGRPPSPGRGRPDDRDRDRRDRIPSYRQRSPMRRGQSPPPNGRDQFRGEKWVDFDHSIPSGCIKVYSRTLFVGGVTCSEEELRSIFGQFGQVQTAIVNKEKRHAFVKMFYRRDAETARAAMEDNPNHDLHLRTRWGVGFGPRDCSDYATGISIIPIQKLTEADRKWMLTAPYGGSGGQPIVSGMCVEEPDIEIGAGVSSKAISRRMQTDKGGNHGPKSSRREEESGGGGGGGGGGGRWRRDKHRGGHDGPHRRDGGMGGPGGDRGNEDPLVEGLPPGISIGPNGIELGPNYRFGGN